MSAERVRTWATKVREATERRDEAIREMRDEGASLREIAAVASLSHTTIANIVRKD